MSVEFSILNFDYYSEIAVYFNNYPIIHIKIIYYTCIPSKHNLIIVVDHTNAILILIYDSYHFRLKIEKT